MRFSLSSLVPVLVALSCMISVFSLLPNTVLAATAGPITGYAWSDTIGWISLNCSNTGSCGSNNYGLAVATNGTVSGYAWSDSIGWIAAYTSSSGCPVSPCQAKVTLGTVSGWLQAVSGGSAQSGGWDGWISLKGSGYGPTVTNGAFSGYGWGDTVVGWVDFSSARTTFDDSCAPIYSCNSGNTAVLYTNAACVTTTVASCTSPAYCSAGTPSCVYPPPTFVPGSGTSGHLQVKPQVVAKGKTANVLWNVSNAASCSVTGTNGQSWNTASGNQTTSRVTQQITFTLACTGLDGSHIQETQTVNLLPEFHEL